MGAIRYVGAGGQENKVSMSLCWYTGHGFGPYGWGISPDVMFWVGNQKMSRMCTDGHRLVWMCEVGLVGKGATRNSKKKFENACIGRGFL